jgi:hypothetical protein
MREAPRPDCNTAHAAARAFLGCGSEGPGGGVPYVNLRHLRCGQCHEPSPYGQVFANEALLSHAAVVWLTARQPRNPETLGVERVRVDM